MSSNQTISKNWPHYFNEMIHTEEKLNNVVILTLWSKKEIYIKSIPKELYNSIGQLYSREEGLSALIRNLCLNTHITDLVIVGADLNYCSNAIIALFEKGVNEKNEIICEHYSKLDDEISFEAIERIRKNVKLHNFRAFKDKKELNEELSKLQNKNQGYHEIKSFKQAEIKLPDTFPSAKMGYTIHSSYIKDAWIQVLKHIMNFGTIKKSQYGDSQRELIGLMVTISKEESTNPQLIDEFGFNEQELKNYIPQVTTANSVEGLEYTYGERLFNHKKIDQINNIIDQINSEEYTRRAIAFTWNVEEDYSNPKCPCLNVVHVLVQDNTLFMTCYFRSNDMFEAWPRNCFALRALQEIICKRTNKDIGHITVISNSAHVYERSFKKINDIIIKKQKKVTWDQDPNGTISIQVIKDSIQVKHLDTTGKRLEEFEGKTAIELYKYISNSFKISDISHAMDIGCELQKAEIALKQKIQYIQDKPLELI